MSIVSKYRQKRSASTSDPPVARLLSESAEEGGLDGRWPQADQTPTLGTGSEAVNGAGRDEDQGAGQDSFCRIGVGVEGVGALEDVEGFCFVVRVRRGLEAGVLPCLAGGPVAAGLGTRNFAGDVRLETAHGQNDAVPICRSAQDHPRPLVSGVHSRPPITDGWAGRLRLEPGTAQRLGSLRVGSPSRTWPLAAPRPAWQLMRVPKDPRFWLQLRLQLRPSAVVRPRSRSYIGARQAAYGTAANRQERDHDGLAVWGSGVRVPSA